MNSIKIHMEMILGEVEKVCRVYLIFLDFAQVVVEHLRYFVQE